MKSNIYIYIYIYVKDPHEVKYQYLIKQNWEYRLKYGDPKAYIEYSNDKQDL